MSDSHSVPPAGASAQARRPPRDVMARLPQHRSACIRCGYTVTIPEAQLQAACPRCGGEGIAERSRESIPPNPNGPSRPSLFDAPVNRLPFGWIFRVSGRNLFRYLARHGIDSFSLALAIGTVAISIPSGPRMRDWLVDWPTLARPFIGLSAAVTGTVLVILYYRTSRKQWGMVTEGRPRETDAPAPGGPAPGTLRERLRRVRVHAKTWLSRRPMLRPAPYLTAVYAAAAALAMLHSVGLTPYLVVILGSLSVFVTVSAFFIGLCKAAFNRIPPEEYASLVLGGRSVEDMFRWIGWEMFSLCARFLDFNSDPLRRAQTALSTGVAGVYEQLRDDNKALLSNHRILELLRQSLPGQDGLSRLTRHIDRLEEKLLRQRMGIRRCAAMKTLAATDFGIHHRRLCDHVFRFSPTIYERRTRKYIANWRAISRSLEANRSHVSGWRVIDLIQENERIFRRIERRSNYLRLIVDSAGVFQDVRMFASTTSLRDSLTAYASALTRLAESFVASGNSFVHQARLASLYEMQEAHPGIDLHRALTQLCRGGAPWCEARIVELEERVAFLRSPADGRWEQDALRAEAKCRELREHAALWKRCTNVLDTVQENGGHGWAPGLDLDVLRELATLVGAATHNTQWEINRRMEAELLGWMRHRSNVLIMTYGNSRVVRDVLKCVAMPLMKKREGETHHDALFIARTEADEFESRMMAFALREDSRWYHPGKTAELGYGDDELLLSLLEDLRDRDQSVMILLGAESFDPEGRIIQIASAYPQIRRLKNRLRKFNRHDRDRVLFVAVAESYKKSDDLTRDTGFYRDHLDQVALYPKGVIDLIISNDRRYDTRPPPQSPLDMGSATVYPP